MNIRQRRLPINDQLREALDGVGGEPLAGSGFEDEMPPRLQPRKSTARAVGVEIRPDLCRQAQARIKALGLEDRVTMVEGSALRVDLGPADVVTMYFLTTSNERMKPNLERMKPGSRVISNEFPIKGWKPVEVVHVKTGSMDHSIFVYQIGHTR